MQRHKFRSGLGLETAVRAVHNLVITQIDYSNRAGPGQARKPNQHGQN